MGTIRKRGAIQWIVVAAVVAGAAGSTIWRMTAGQRGPRPRPEIEARAERIRSEILDYTPPELNVPDTAPRPEKLQTQPTRQPQKVQ